MINKSRISVDKLRNKKKIYGKTLMDFFRENGGWNRWMRPCETADQITQIMAIPLSVMNNNRGGHR